MSLRQIDLIKFSINEKKDIVYSFSGKVNENSIIKCVQDVERLTKNKTNPAKAKKVYELLIEVLQNMLNYSYDTIRLNENRHEATCSFTIRYKTKDDIFIIKSCNLIKAEQKDIIISRLNEVKDLDKQALRELIRSKIRSKHNKHEKGAGLGFIMMAKKTAKPIEYSFTPAPENKNILIYKQKLVI